ncbi:MAG TPA: DUF3107 domain-containing protein [Nocardioidaceae bacterium]|nr:DUF3107 domain-containing protein [Nocardioidaceae bacterium]
MEVKIGVQNVNRELVLDIDQSGEDIEAAVAKALSGDDPVVSLTDDKGRKVLVPTDKLAYIELGSPTIGQVGFRS